MKILHITTHMGGGAGKAISGIIHLGMKRMESTLMILEKPCEKKHILFLEKKGVPVVYEPSYEEVQKEMQMADVVVLNWWGHPLMIRYMEAIQKVPCRLILWSHINGCTYPFLKYDFLNVFDGLMFTTPMTLKKLRISEEQREHIKEKSVVVYGMGDFEPGNIVPKSCYGEKNEYVIGYVGTLNFAKLSPDFLKYYKIALCENDNAICYMLGNLSQEVWEEINAENMSDKFIFPGFIENTEKYYQMMDVFIYLLNKDNYATTENSLLEAMAYGIPIIVFDNEVEKNIIINGENGFLINDEKEFLDIVKKLKNVKFSERIGKKSREFCINHYSADDNFEKFYDMCRKCKEVIPHRHRIEEIIGKKAYEKFLYFSGEDSILFEEIWKNSDKEFIKQSEIKSIYKQSGKGSIYQYFRYFPESAELEYVIRKWQES